MHFSLHDGARDAEHDEETDDEYDRSIDLPDDAESQRQAQDTTDEYESSYHIIHFCGSMDVCVIRVSELIVLSLMSMSMLWLVVGAFMNHCPVELGFIALPVVTFALKLAALGWRTAMGSDLPLHLLAVMDFVCAIGTVVLIIVLQEGCMTRMMLGAMICSGTMAIIVICNHVVVCFKVNMANVANAA